MGGRKGSLLEKTAQLLDLPADAMAGVPRLELVGTGELRMDCLLYTSPSPRDCS